MSTARCTNCGKMLGQTEDDITLDVRPKAAQADKNRIVFFVKCPRCGRLNAVNFIKSEKMI